MEQSDAAVAQVLSDLARTFEKEGGRPGLVKVLTYAASRLEAKPARKVVQVATCAVDGVESVIALTEDGVLLWQPVGSNDWTRLPPIPQDDKNE